MTPSSALVLALVVAAQSPSPTNGPPWLAALIGVGGAVLGAVAAWFGAKTKAEKSAALVNTINAIPTAWIEVLKANPGIPQGELIGEVLKAAASFAGRALTETERRAAATAVEAHRPEPTALASAVGAALVSGEVTKKFTVPTTSGGGSKVP